MVKPTSQSYGPNHHQDASNDIARMKGIASQEGKKCWFDSIECLLSLVANHFGLAYEEEIGALQHVS
jgi:hypothetical protein